MCHLFISDAKSDDDVKIIKFNNIAKCASPPSKQLHHNEESNVEDIVISSDDTDQEQVSILTALYQFG